MKDKKTFARQNKTLIIRLILMSIIGIVAIFSDYWLKLINTSLNDLVTILFSTVTVIA